MRNLATFGLLFVLTLTLLGCGEPEPEGLALPMRDDFDGAMSLDWTVLDGIPEGVSLEAKPGFLSLTPQTGRILRDYDTSESGPPKNFHVIKLSEADQDLVVTLVIEKFTPTIKHENVSLLFYDDADNYVMGRLKLIEDVGIQWVFTRETDGEMRGSSPVACFNSDERLKLKIRKEGDSYRFYYSDMRGGRDHQVGSKVKWGDGTPQYVGFFASTAHFEPEGVEDVAVESFQIIEIESPAED